MYVNQQIQDAGYEIHDPVCKMLHSISRILYVFNTLCFSSTAFKKLISFLLSNMSLVFMVSNKSLSFNDSVSTSVSR